MQIIIDLIANLVMGDLYCGCRRIWDTLSSEIIRKEILHQAKISCKYFYEDDLPIKG